MTAAPGEQQWDETERALRRLLEAAVPAPGAPADRMARIRHRARRRRRRNAATATAAVAAVAALALVLPKPHTGPPRTRDLPAASPSPTLARDPASPVRLLGPERAVSVTLPRGWDALTAEDAHGTPVAFIASQPLSRPGRGTCVILPQDALRGCPPLSRLAGGGVLVVLRRADPDAADAAKTLKSIRGLAIDSCESVGAKGKSLYWKAKGSTPADPLVLLLSVCRAAPQAADADPGYADTVSERTAAALQAVLGSMTSADGT